MIDKKFELDYTPAVAYIQDKPVGIGKLYLNGVQARGLIDIRISAHTRDEEMHFSTMKLEIDPVGFANSLVKEETNGLDK
ncbi:MAG: hypothetical protein WC373_13810 [Smithella sp.]|jgi:hypothetical protein